MRKVAAVVATLVAVASCSAPGAHLPAGGFVWSDSDTAYLLQVQPTGPHTFAGELNAATVHVHCESERETVSGVVNGPAVTITAAGNTITGRWRGADLLLSYVDTGTAKAGQFVARPDDAAATYNRLVSVLEQQAGDSSCG